MILKIMADSHPIYSNPNKPQFREQFAIYRSSVSQDTFNAALSAIEPSDELSQPFPPAFPPERVLFKRSLPSIGDYAVPVIYFFILSSLSLLTATILINLGCYLSIWAPTMTCHGKWIICGILHIVLKEH